LQDIGIFNHFLKGFNPKNAFNFSVEGIILNKVLLPHNSVHKLLHDLFRLLLVERSLWVLFVRCFIGLRLHVFFPLFLACLRFDYPLLDGLKDLGLDLCLGFGVKFGRSGADLFGHILEATLLEEFDEVVGNFAIHI
jgi:hypothetical protein